MVETWKLAFAAVTVAVVLGTVAAFYPPPAPPPGTNPCAVPSSLRDLVSQVERDPRFIAAESASDYHFQSASSQIESGSAGGTGIANVSAVSLLFYSYGSRTTVTCGGLRLGLVLSQLTVSVPMGSDGAYLVSNMTVVFTVHPSANATTTLHGWNGIRMILKVWDGGYYFYWRELANPISRGHADSEYLVVGSDVAWGRLL